MRSVCARLSQHPEQSPASTRSAERPPAPHQVVRPSTMGSTVAGTSPAAEVQSIWFLIWTQAAEASAFTARLRSGHICGEVLSHRVDEVRDGAVQLLNRPPIAVSTASFASCASTPLEERNHARTV